MRKNLLVILSVFFITTNCFSAVSGTPNSIKEVLLNKYMTNYENKSQVLELKKFTLLQGGQSVEALIEVMKNGKYPDKNRWMATFLLGQIMGEKSAPFISKFLKHPSWVLRMASLKTLLMLKQDRYANQYISLLNDNSLIVRTQALENIRLLKIKKAAPNVWAMLYDKKNYSEPTINGKKLKRRSNLIKNVIATVGELKLKEATAPLHTMIQKDRYKDIFPEMDNALSEITGSKSPNGDMKAKRIFWSRARLNTTIL